ncbi:MAG: SpoIIE family protein phosphatase [Planctomycetota bacterium]
MPIRRQLLVWVVAPIVLIYGAVFMVERSHLRSRASSLADAQYYEALARRAEALSAEALRAQLAARGVAETIARSAVPAEAVVDAAHRALAEVSLVGAVRVCIAGYGAADEKTVAFAIDRSGRAGALPTAAGVPVTAGWSSGRPADGLRYASYTATATGGDGRRVWVTVDMPAEAWGDRLADPIVNRSLLLLIDGDGRYLWHYNPEVMAADPTIFEFADQVERPSIAAVGEGALRRETGRVRMPVGFITPEPYLGYYRPVAGTDWSLVTGVPERELYAATRSALVQSGLVMLGGLALIVGVVWWSAGRIARPLERISSAAGSLEAGKPYGRQAEGDAPREVRALDAKLVEMSANLRASLDRQVAEARARESAEGELRVAREMQESLLPPVPEEGAFDRFGLRLHAVNIPARAVAGDFYDHFVDRRGRLIVCIADVSGKGARAAMLMAVTRTALRTAADGAEGPGELLQEVNVVLLQNTHSTDGSFVTMQVLCFEPGGPATYASAGHLNATVLSSSSPPLPTAGTTGTVVGVIDEPALNATTGDLSLPQDWTHLVLVTDGVMEAARFDEQGRRVMLNEAGLHAALASVNGPTAPRERWTAQRVTAAVVDAVVAHEGEQRSDDLTVVTLERLGPSRG